MSTPLRRYNSFSSPRQNWNERDQLRSLRDLPKSRFATRPCITIIQPRRPRPIVFSHIEVYKMVESIATELREAGVRPQTACAFLLPSGIESTVYFLALQWIGAIAVPIDPNLDESLLGPMLKTVSALTVVSPYVDEDDRQDNELFQKVSRVCEQGNHVHWMIDRSTNKGVYLEMCGRRAGEQSAWAGGAGDFKFESTDISFHLSSVHPAAGLSIEISNGDISQITRLFVDSYKLSEQSSTLLVLPVHSIHGLLSVLSTLTAGGNMVVIEKMELNNATIMQYISTLHTNWLTLDSNSLSSLLADVLNTCKDPKSSPLKSLNFVRCVGSALSVDLLDKISSFVGGPILQSYGTTETCGLVTTNTIEDNKHSSHGKAVGAIEVSIFNDETREPLPFNEEGLIGIYTGDVENPGDVKESFFVKYENNFFFLSGDKGYLDAEGYLCASSLTSREDGSREMINLLAEKVAKHERDLQEQEQEKEAEKIEEENVIESVEVQGDSSDSDVESELEAESVEEEGEEEEEDEGEEDDQEEHAGKEEEEEESSVAVEEENIVTKESTEGEKSDEDIQQVDQSEVKVEEDELKVDVGKMVAKMVEDVEGNIELESKQDNEDELQSVADRSSSHVVSSSSNSVQEDSDELERSENQIGNSSDSSPSRSASVTSDPPVIAPVDGVTDREVIKEEIDGDDIKEEESRLVVAPSKEELIETNVDQGHYLIRDLMYRMSKMEQRQSELEEEVEEARQFRKVMDRLDDVEKRVEIIEENRIENPKTITNEAEQESKADEAEAVKEEGEDNEAETEGENVDPNTILPLEVERSIRASSSSSSTSTSVDSDEVEVVEGSGVVSEANEEDTMEDSIEHVAAATNSLNSNQLSSNQFSSNQTSSDMPTGSHSRLDSEQTETAADTSSSNSSNNGSGNDSDNSENSNGASSTSNIRAIASNIEGSGDSNTTSSNSTSNVEHTSDSSDLENSSDLEEVEQVPSVESRLEALEAYIMKLDEDEGDETINQEVLSRLSTIEDNQRKLDEDIEKGHRKEMIEMKTLLEEMEKGHSLQVAATQRCATEIAHATRAIPKQIPLDLDVEELARSVRQAAASATKSSRDTTAAAAAAREAADAAKSAASAHAALLRKPPGDGSASSVKKSVVISLDEIEQTVMTHPSVKTARAFGHPDKRVGTEVFCVISLKEGARISEPWLKLFVSSILPPPYVPKAFFYKEDLVGNEDRKILGTDKKLRVISEVTGYNRKRTINRPSWGAFRRKSEA